MFKYLFAAALLAAPVCHADSNATLFATVKNWFKDPFGYAEERNKWLLRYEFREHYGRGPLLQEIQGFDSAKLALTWLLQYVQDPVSNHGIFTNYILYGIPGSGKSGFVHALMREIKNLNPAFRTFEIPFEELFKVLEQDTEENFIQRFRVHAPCVVYIRALYSPHAAYHRYSRKLEILNKLSQWPDCPVITILTPSKLEAIDISYQCPIEARSILLSR